VDDHLARGGRVVAADTEAGLAGMFGGAAPDALAALASLRDGEGNTTVSGLDNSQEWPGAIYPEDQFRSDAGVVDGASLLGSGSVSDMLWARPSLTILGIDCPPVVGSAAAIVPRARARLNLRIPPGTDPAAAEKALTDQLVSAAPWRVHVGVETGSTGSPFSAQADGPAYRAIASAMEETFGMPTVSLGPGGSIPLCNVFAETYPGAEIILMGVEEPLALIHAPNESVHPQEIADMALAEALFLQRLTR
jgi:acetylornithine deacetylase/succinyl-diaminopimelate desuccinylase-like protein